MFSRNSARQASRTISQFESTSLCSQTRSYPSRKFARQNGFISSRSINIRASPRLYQEIRPTIDRDSIPQVGIPNTNPVQEISDNNTTSTASTGQEDIQASKGLFITNDGKELTPMEIMDMVQAQGPRGKKLAIMDENGEQHVLAYIPDDVRTHSIWSSDWIWGVTERLLQDCEQAKIQFEKEDYFDEETKKTKQRIVSDEEGQHTGSGKGWWFDVLDLPPTFNTYVVVTFLHMWILKVRTRQLPRKMASAWDDLLTNHFFWGAEKTMDYEHKMDGSSRKKYIDHYFHIWTGTILAYDEGMVGGDAALGAAVWRMLFNADPDVDPVKIALVVAYMRREIARLGHLDDRTIARGYVGFGEPVKDEDLFNNRAPSAASPLRPGIKVQPMAATA